MHARSWVRGGGWRGGGDADRALSPPLLSCWNVRSGPRSATAGLTPSGKKKGLLGMFSRKKSGGQ